MCIKGNKFKVMIEELMIEENVLKRIIRTEKDKKNMSGCIKQLLIYQTSERMVVCPRCTYRNGCIRNYLKVIK